MWLAFDLFGGGVGGVGLFLFSRLLNILNNGQRSDETILHGGLLRSK